MGIFLTYYQEILCPEYNSENQEGYWELIAENVGNALRGRAFLWKSGDRSVCHFNQVAVCALTSLYAQGPPDHPAIEALVVNFFYCGDGCLAAFFPDDFSHTIPKCALALAMTCVGIFLLKIFTVL
jgi:hypothetical protein